VPLFRAAHEIRRQRGDTPSNGSPSRKSHLGPYADSPHVDQRQVLIVAGPRLAHLKLRLDSLIRRVAETVNLALELPESSTRHISSTFPMLVARVLRRGKVKMGAILVTLVYLDRAKPHLEVKRLD
jgi:hypothetical protein